MYLLAYSSAKPGCGLQAGLDPRNKATGPQFFVDQLSFSRVWTLLSGQTHLHSCKVAAAASDTPLPKLKDPG